MSTHRAHAAHPDPLVPVADGQPLGESDGGVLGHAVGRRAQLGEQTGGRRDRDEMSAAALKPLRHNSFRCSDVSTQVDVDDPIPRGFVVAEAGFTRDPGICDIDVYSSERAACGIEESGNTLGARASAAIPTPPIDAAVSATASASMSPTTTEDPGRGQRHRNGPADTRTRSGDHRHRSVDVHGGDMSSAPAEDRAARLLTRPGTRCCWK